MSGQGLMLKHKWFLVISLALLLGLLPIFVFGKPASGAGTLPTGFVQTRFAEGLTDPTAMAFAPDARLFVAEQRGTLQVVSTNGTLQGTPFLDISSKVNAAGERGLLGVAFDPNFDPTFTITTNNYVYVYYTHVDATQVHNRVSRFPASLDGNGNVVAGNEEITFELPPLAATNHNGGAIHFGIDGKLYVAVGENARPAAAQDLNIVLGKMLRINKDGMIPGDNPFYAQTTGNNRAIWAFGLRNPYSFDVQPNTGRIFINDVGEKAWEEINEGIAGANYGWPIYEGPVSYTPSKSKKRHKGRHKHRHKQRHKQSYDNTSPLLYAYPHSMGCAITGGAFYNPPTVPPPFPADYVGDYFFADFCEGWISKFDPATKTVVGFKSASSEQPVDLKVSTEGDLYVLARGTSSVEKISYTP